MANRDRPGREVKKKPKEKGARPNLQPLAEGPQNVELIKKARKPRHTEDQEQG